MKALSSDGVFCFKIFQIYLHWFKIFFYLCRNKTDMTLITDFTFTGDRECACKYGRTVLYTEFAYNGSGLDFFETNAYTHYGDPKIVQPQERLEILRQITDAIYASDRFAEIERNFEDNPYDIHQQWREDEMMGN